MKRTLHFESIGGASGDMILGALVGLGVPVEELNHALKSL
ncbi:nickel insertion protein, partial [Pontiella sp.]